MINKIAIIGGGLMGASLARALQDNNIAKEILILVRKEEQVALLKEKNIEASLSYADLYNANVVFIAAPLQAYESIFRKLNKVGFAKVPIISDLGSAKMIVSNWAKKLLKRPLFSNFVPSHPIAGSHLSGAGVIVESLYKKKKLIITCQKSKASEFLAVIWRKIGSNVKYVEANLHDRIYAIISHIPQKLAFEFYEKHFVSHETLKKAEEEIKNPLFTEFVRLCYSNKYMWNDVFEYNKEYKKVFPPFYKRLKVRIEEVKEVFIKSGILKKALPSEYQEIFIEAFVISAYLKEFVELKLDSGEIDSYAGTGYRSIKQLAEGFSGYLEAIKSS